MTPALIGHSPACSPEAIGYSLAKAIAKCDGSDPDLTRAKSVARALFTETTGRQPGNGSYTLEEYRRVGARLETILHYRDELREFLGTVA